MNARRISILLGRELVRGPRSFIFIFAVVTPLVLSFLVSLIFGTLFAGKPRVGLVNVENSAVSREIVDLDAFTVKTYDSTAAMKQAVENGAVDVGVTFPPEFDAQVQAGEPAMLTAFIWGESMMKHRASVAATLAVLIRQVGGQESAVEIVTATLGDGEALPWEVRLLPFLVLLTMMIGGLMVPATSLVEEKQKRTLTALTITPTSLGDVYVAKGLLGWLLSVVMGVLILAINRAFGTQPLLLLVTLALGAAMSAVFGVLLGMLMKDINTLFATIKGMGILLYAPAIVYLFPAIPQWVGQIFPTYYMIQPVVEIAQENAGWAEVLPELGVLVGLTAVLIIIVAVISRRQQAGAPSLRAA